jgi:hypothetical protein
MWTVFQVGPQVAIKGAGPVWAQEVLMIRGLLFSALALLVMLPTTAWGQLSSAWIVPAAAHTAGVNSTFWMTDLSIHNPQNAELPVVVQFLASGADNMSVPTLDLTLGSWQTANLWDVLGPDYFSESGTGALLVYVPLEVACSEDLCDFLVTSRTYTLDPAGGVGEFGQAVPANTVIEGVDWASFGYGAGVLNDGNAFRCNAGVASWSSSPTVVQMDVQDGDGAILDTEVFELPAFGHVQRRVRQPVTGGSLVFYLVEGPDDAVVYPYASVVDQDTGDPTFVPVRWSTVGVTAKRGGASRIDRETPVPRASSRRAVAVTGPNDGEVNQDFRRGPRLKSTVR